MCNDYRLLRLCDAPELERSAAEWFNSKWGIPMSAYLESMDACLRGEAAVPQWYLALERQGGDIVGGMGVIENDFHDRPDLSPNVCAVYVDEKHRGRGLAGSLLELVCRDMKSRGISTLYLLTDHTGFYERYGWSFLCMAQGDGDDAPSRMYVHQA